MLRGFCSILWRLSTCWGWLPWRSPVRLSSRCRRGSRGCPSSPCWWLQCTAPWEFVTPSCACMPACCCNGRTSLNCCDMSRVRSPIPLPPSKAPTWLLTGTGGRKWLKVSWGCSRRRSETSSEQQWEELKLWQRLELRGRTQLLLHPKLQKGRAAVRESCWCKELEWTKSCTHNVFSSFVWLFNKKMNKSVCVCVALWLW